MLKWLSGKYKKAFIFGVGGGNDIVSAALVGLYAQRIGLSCDIGGVLSPVASHFFEGKRESVINELAPGLKVERFIQSLHGTKISFIDPILANSISGQMRVFDISYRFGAGITWLEFSSFIERNGYDVVIGVDVGGDILGDIRQDKKLLSPIMDFLSLQLLGTVRVDSYLVEFGLGTDGELEESRFPAILSEMDSLGAILATEDILGSDVEIKRFCGIMEEVGRIRQGHTATMLMRTLENKNITLRERYRFASRIADKSWMTEFSVTLPARYAGKVWFMDSKRVYRARAFSATYHLNYMEMFFWIKSAAPSWKTDMDLGYVWFDGEEFSSINNGSCFLLLVPSTFIAPETRKEILQTGILAIENYCNYVIVRNEDLGLCPPNDVTNSGFLDVIVRGKFFAVVGWRNALGALERDSLFAQNLEKFL